MAQPEQETSYETIDRFTQLPEANGARSLLESAGFEPRLLDEMTGSIDWALMPALGGLRLQVPADRAAEARELLATASITGEEEDPDEIFARERAARRKRLVGLVALLLLLLPTLLAILFGGN